MAGIDDDGGLLRVDGDSGSKVHIVPVFQEGGEQNAIFLGLYRYIFRVGDSGLQVQHYPDDVVIAVAQARSVLCIANSGD